MVFRCEPWPDGVPTGAGMPHAAGVVSNDQDREIMSSE